MDYSSKINTINKELGSMTYDTLLERMEIIEYSIKSASGQGSKTVLVPREANFQLPNVFLKTKTCNVISLMFSDANSRKRTDESGDGMHMDESGDGMHMDESGDGMHMDESGDGMRTDGPDNGMHTGDGMHTDDERYGGKWNEEIDRAIEILESIEMEEEEKVELEEETGLIESELKRRYGASQ